MDWIQGNKFKNIAKWHYAPASGQGVGVKNNFSPDHYCYIENTFDKDSVIDGDIIYTPTFFADSLLDVLRTIDKKVIVITHNSDTNFTITPPDNVIMWFTQNVNIIHDRVQSIPIGLENDIWFPETNKKKKMLEKLKEPRNYRNLVYMNHNIATNPAKRTKPYEILKDKSWVTTYMGENGVGFDEYLDNIYNHKFVVCPEGNGIDTHRIWEVLYMESIPITEDNININFYGGLPIVAVSDWEELEENILATGFPQMKTMEWEYGMLTFEYWKNEIYGVED